jgi:hypothetical protein
MAQINATKVLAGGILAGLVLAAFDFASNNFLLAAEWQNLAQRHNLDPALMGSTAALVTMILVDMALGQLIAVAYAGILPRFGGGAGTAIIAGALIFAPQALLLATFAGWFVPWEFLFRLVVVMLVANLGAGLAGAWIYGADEELS